MFPSSSKIHKIHFSIRHRLANKNERKYFDFSGFALFCTISEKNLLGNLDREFFYVLNSKIANQLPGGATSSCGKVAILNKNVNFGKIVFLGFSLLPYDSSNARGLRAGKEKFAFQCKSAEATGMACWTRALSSANALAGCITFLSSRLIGRF